MLGQTGKAEDEKGPHPRAATPVEKKVFAAGQFQLQGIMGAKAMINNKVVAAGDDIGGAKVIAVTKDEVKLEYMNEEMTLKL